MHESHCKRPLSVHLALAVTLALILRLPNLAADPPVGDISRSATFLADEGIHGHNALHWALLGEWYIDDGFNPGVNTPVFMLFDYAAFRLLGVSLYSVRIAAVACSVVVLLLLAALMAEYSPRAAMLAAYGWALCFPAAVYNRLGLMENLLLIWMLGMAWFWLRIVRRPGSAVAELLFVAVGAAAYLTKPSFLFLPAALASLLVYYQGRDGMRSLLRLAALAVLAGTVLWLFWIAPHREDWMYYQNLNMKSRLPQSLGEVLRNYARYAGHLKLFEFMPVVYTLALVQCGKATAQWIRRQAPPKHEALFYAWLVAGIAFLGMFAYSPPRYSLLLTPAIVGLAARLVDDLLGGGDFKAQRSLLWGVGILVVLQIGFGGYRFFILGQRFLSCVLPVAGLVTLALWVQWTSRSELFARLLIIAIVAVQTLQFVNYHSRPEFSLLRTAQDVARIVRKSLPARRPVLAGDSAMLLALEARVPAVGVMYRQDRLPQAFLRWQPSHLFLEDPTELSRLQLQLSGLRLRFVPLKNYELMHNYAHGRDAILYRIEWRE